MKKQILYIDNDIASYVLVSAILDDPNIEITHCRDGLTAIKFFKQYPLFDLIITEIKVPIVNGFTILHEIRRIKPAIPIIAQTASVLNNMKEKCLEAGFNEFLAKPIDVTQFASIVGNCIKNQLVQFDKLS
ncbi:MAG TPA: response regulator [Bacteroidales bacterium]